MGVFPHGHTPNTVVIPVGDPSSRACETVAETIRETFEIPVSVRRRIDEPEAETDESAAALAYLECVSEVCDESVDLAVGVTDDPLVEFDGMPSLFGIGVDRGRAGVVSTARLIGDDASADLAHERLEKETRSILGKLLGLRTHVDDDNDGSPTCIMEATDSLSRLDRAPASYCTECWSALTDDSAYPKPPKPDGWFVRTEDDDAFETALRWARGETTWRDYPVMALGWIVVTVAPVWRRVRSILGRISLPAARDLPRTVHDIYRIVRFWTNVVLYLGSIFLWLLVALRVHDVLVGSDPSDGMMIVLLTIGLLLGVYFVWILKGIAIGIYLGLRGAPMEKLD